MASSGFRSHGRVDGKLGDLGGRYLRVPAVAGSTLVARRALMDSRLPVRRAATARVKSSAVFGRFNAIEMLLFGLIGVALIDCGVIVWLVVRGFGD
jgi:hypothetical protein